MPPVHPGEILLEEFLHPLDVSQYQLAKELGIPARRINEIVHGQRRISVDTALRLARYLGISGRFWMNLQTRYDLEIEKDRLGTVLDEIHRLSAQADQRAPCPLWREPRLVMLRRRYRTRTGRHADLHRHHERGRPGSNRHDQLGRSVASLRE